MSRNDKIAVFMIVLVVGIILGTIWGAYLSRHDYCQGQIDALIGKVKYELKVNPDSTVTWHKKRVE